MYASAIRKACDLVEDDRISIGENGSLFRIQTIKKIDGFVEMDLYLNGDERQTIVATLRLAPHMTVKAYNQ